MVEKVEAAQGVRGAGGSHGKAGDLHVGFGDPGRAAPSALTAFLEEADRVPAIRAVHRAMRAALRPWPGARLLDAGCGIGLEAARLAEDYPEVRVTGLDLNADLIATARQRAGAGRGNLGWVHADLTDLALPGEAFDLVRTERVLQYFAGNAFGDAVGALLRQLRPGGRVVSFELDYGATILPAGPDDDLTRELTAVLEGSLPQPWAGRRLPAALAERGLTDVTATPYAFAVSEPVWRAIVLETLRLAAAENRLSPAALGQLEAQSEGAAGSSLLAAFCGVVVAGTKPWRLTGRG